MGLHRARLGRRGMVALAATGALIVGGGAAAMVGTGSAAPLVPPAVPVVGNTYVLPDLAPFERTDIRGAGTAEVSDEFEAPVGGGEAALRLTTPGGSDKAAVANTEDAGPGLDRWITVRRLLGVPERGGQRDPVPELPARRRLQRRRGRGLRDPLLRAVLQRRGPDAGRVAPLPGRPGPLVLDEGDPRADRRHADLLLERRPAAARGVRRRGTGPGRQRPGDQPGQRQPGARRGRGPRLARRAPPTTSS